MTDSQRDDLLINLTKAVSKIQETLIDFRKELKEEIKQSAEQTKAELREEIRLSAEQTKTELRKEFQEQCQQNISDLGALLRTELRTMGHEKNAIKKKLEIHDKEIKKLKEKFA